ncbi:hypothetical protein Aci011_120 [Acinetobacter phage vB_AbaM_B09_Aci01-1]|uniref:Uncharacterized protein n=2 Tax=Saclayvirus TaxID=2733128 RepID=A0A386KDZ1_9CAUD|nr:hypothetical protein HOU29_gp061 [Acinetobacter phage vB_AbaM_B09_Aci01-1]YP_009813971.1 hypothetical protein HOU35_gp060 [Acinetobacter phage vB_AbaM_B09_Aci05]QMP19046.1 hypothetical protein FKOIJHOC_00098 [Acinetobacter phage Ab_121]QQV88816.1 hypothetical protein Liucustia_116 [Acinetobacter phage Liucustia]AYD82420.1 hypothetical protein Aci05_117 [Acinetobacter phage vB_AbaM_B09_Aci05]AYD85635.1 hypothetical protein Aci011_120 [Acinetobacter phage vB_AbaM_B09_Aci01-1]
MMLHGRKTTYKDSVQRLLNCGANLEEMMIEMLEFESTLSAGLKERHWTASFHVGGELKSLTVVPEGTELSFRVQDLAKYRVLLTPEELR